jgi:hypothetical protein
MARRPENADSNCATDHNGTAEKRVKYPRESAICGGACALLPH